MDKGKSGDDKSNDSVIIFDGKEPNRAAKWFELSQATERFAEYHCGTPGVEIWLGVSPELTDENVTDAAQDALVFIRVYNGIGKSASQRRSGPEGTLLRYMVVHDIGDGHSYVRGNCVCFEQTSWRI